MKVYVVLNDQECRDFLKQVQPDDVVVGRVKPSCECRFINVLGAEVNHAELADKFRNLIQKQNEPFQSIINNYINVLYQSSVEPLFQYLAALKDAEKFGNTTDVILQSAQRKLATSTFYMAEHESQGYRWYERGAVLGYYIFQYCKVMGLRVSIAKQSSLFKLRLYGFLRIYPVLLIKFCISFVNLILYSPFFKNRPVKSDVVVTTRAVSQSKFFLPYLKHSNLSASLLVGESTVDFGNNQRWLASQSRESVGLGDNCIYSRRSIFVLVRYSLLTLARLFLYRESSKLEFQGVTLNLHSAFREALVLSPELLTYSHSIEAQVRRIVTKSGSILKAIITSEQKSPHAVIDAAVAKKHGLKCIQFMSCDQEYCFIPLPIAGDYFLCDTDYSRRKFLEIFPSENFIYVGTLKGLSIQSSTKQKKLICYYTNPKNTDINCAVIEVLLNVLSNNGTEFVVKLHPRDHLSRYKKFKNVIFLEHGNPRSDRLLDEVSLAITGNSGIVMDLLNNRVCYLLLRLKPEDHIELPYVDTEYKNVCFEISEIPQKLTELDKTFEEFDKFLKRFQDRNNIIVDVDKINERMERLLSS